MQNTDVLYDLSAVGYRDGHWFYIATAVLLVALLLHIRQRKHGRKGGMPPWFVVCMGLVVLAFGAIPLWDHHRLMGHLQAGRTQVAEGVVTSHSVEVIRKRRHNSSGYDSSTWEAFRVGEVAFGFYRGDSPVGFINSGSDTVELRDGQALRVHYYEDVPGDFAHRRILRLERTRATSSTS